MRRAVGVVFGVGMLIGGWGAAEAQEKLIIRYGVPATYDKYPQDNPKGALASVVKAIELGQIDYLVAHLADPGFVDKRVGEFRSQVTEDLKEDAKTLLAFDRLVKETTEHFKADPAAVKELQQFARSGEWTVQNDAAEAKVASVPTRHVFMKKSQQLWYLEDRQK
jgi:hypothetical protein